MARPRSESLIGQFLRFGIVGATGYVVDAGLLRVELEWLGLGYYDGRVLSFLAAACTTYLLNRVWTFRHAPRVHAHRQAPLWVALMTVGFVVNYGTFALCLKLDPIFLRFPELAVACGSLAGMGVNFFSARRIIFRTVKELPSSRRSLGAD